MNWIDYCFIGVLVISVLFGAFRGLLREGLSLATWILAFSLSLRYGPEVADRLKASVEIASIRLALGYAACFFGVLLVGALVMVLVSLALRGSALSGVDRVLGAGFGVVRGALIVTAIVMLATVMDEDGGPAWRRSRLIPEIVPVAKELRALIPERWLAYLRPHDTDFISPPATRPSPKPR